VSALRAEHGQRFAAQDRRRRPLASGSPARQWDYRPAALVRLVWLTALAV
jgi:hypothetical protein